MDVDLNFAFSEIKTLGPSQLLVKQNGLTSISPVELSKLQPSSSSLWEPDSGIHFLNTIQLTLFRCPFQKTLRVGMSAPDVPGISFLNFHRTPWESKRVADLCQALKATPKAANNHCLENCSRWLDDWSDYECPPVISPRAEEIQLLRDSHEIRIHINRGCVLSRLSISPQFIDFDGSTVRISERHQNKIVIADLSRTHISEGRSGHSRISLAG